MSSESPATPPKPKTGRVLLVICVLAIGAAGLAFFGITDRAKSRQEVCGVDRCPDRSDGAGRAT